MEPARRWLANLKGWRGGLFLLLGAYAVGGAVFLAVGGGSMQQASVGVTEAAADAVETSQPADATPAATSQPTAQTADTAQANETIACSDIDPVQHEIDPSLAGVHALGFVTLDEVQASFAGYRGCPLIVNFFASWCVPCVTEMPDFERFWNANGTRVAVLGLAANDRLEDAIETVADRGVTYPTGLDEGELFIDFGGLGMPTTVFVSPEGEILETHSGLLTLEDINDRAAEHFGI